MPGESRKTKVNGGQIPILFKEVSETNFNNSYISF